MSDIDLINQTCDLSILIWETENHNKWYGADAINAALSYAFNTLNLYNISLCVKEYNKNAIGLNPLETKNEYINEYQIINVDLSIKSIKQNDYIYQIPTILFENYFLH